jgi:hypothetical protein
MAIISCEECNGKVSDKAVTCPHCGVAVASMGRGTFLERQTSYLREGDEQRLRTLNKELALTGSISKKDNDEREGLIKKLKKADAELAAVRGDGHGSSLVNIGVGAAVGHVLAKAIFKSK